MYIDNQHDINYNVIEKGTADKRLCPRFSLVK